MVNIITGAVQLGLLWSVMAMGVWTTYRVLDYRDLTAEGSMVTGAAVTAALLVAGVNPFLATAASIVRGALTGCVTGLLHTKLRIPGILSGILSMIGLYSVNIRIMGRPNVPFLRTDTLFKLCRDAGIHGIVVRIICSLSIAFLLFLFLSTSLGNALRATGNNETMASALGINTDSMKILGLAISNGAIAFSGSLVSQYQVYADVSMGQGAIVIGLASVIIGEVLFHSRGILGKLLAVVLGAVIYRLLIAFVISMGMNPLDLKLFTAITVAIALSAPLVSEKIKNHKRSSKRGSDGVIS